MRFTQKIGLILPLLIVSVMAVSCIKEDNISKKRREKVSLDAWIRINKPELLDNYQEEGGYYVEILAGDKDEGISKSDNDFGSESLMEQDTCWVFTVMTGRDINGRICATRSWELADMCGTFSYYTHYVPYINYCGSLNMGLMEGCYVAMRNELKIGDTIYKMHKGSKVRLYLPSTIAYGEGGSSAQGGYEGQYVLDGSRPMIMDVEVLRAIKNPSDKELDMVDAYIGIDTKWVQATKPESEKEDAEDDLKLKGLYYALGYNPKSSQAHDKYLQPHLDGLDNKYSDSKKYANMEELNDKINEILLERFGEGLSTEEQSEATEVTRSGRANVWYIVRFLDGFVVDTNIAEIRTLVFNENTPVCEIFSYSPSDDEHKDASERSAIGAWYYCIPYMHHGAYGQIITSSGYAYGATGMTGTTTTDSSSSSTSYYNPMHYYNYYNSYYNYYNPYYNYYDYNYYNYSHDSEDITTTTTISTEILPYTPLVFTLYVEPKQ